MFKLITKENKQYYSIWIVTLLLGITSSLYLPEKFFYDSKMILEIPYVFDNWFKGSYPFTANFYHTLGFSLLPLSWIGFLQITILFFLVLLVIKPKEFTLNKIENVVIVSNVFLLGIFLGQPSKEFIAFIVMFLLLLIIKRESISLLYRCIVSCIILMITAVLFRPYYVFLPFLVFGMYLTLFLFKKNKFLWIVLSGVGMLIVVSLILYGIKGEYLTELYREQINDARRGAEYSNSIITSPLRPITFLNEIFSIVYGIVSVNVPIEGFKHILKPQIVVFVIWQLLFFYFFSKKMIVVIKNKTMESKELLICLFLFSYFILQGVFEPDLGSAVRHKIGVIPFILYIYFYEESSIKKIIR